MVGKPAASGDMTWKGTEMDSDFESGDFESRRGRQAYSGENAWAADPGLRRAAIRREMGVRQTRRASTWVAATLIAGVAATTGYFAHAAATPAASAGSTVQGTGGVTGAAATGHKPSLSQNPVVTSGGSGVTAGTSGPGGTAGTAGIPRTAGTWHDN